MACKAVVTSERGCGRRSPGATYLVGSGNTYFCDRLPMPLPEYECHGLTFKLEFFRGIKKFSPLKYFLIADEPCSPACPVCYPPDRGWFMWVGKEYTPGEFTREARSMMVSKRISKVPLDLELGDMVFLGHQNCILDDKHKPTIPGCFYAFHVTAVEHVLRDSQVHDTDVIKSLESKGITPVIDIPEENFEEMKHAIPETFEIEYRSKNGEESAD